MYAHKIRGRYSEEIQRQFVYIEIKSYNVCEIFL